jgi:hypothetical protein
MDQSFENPGRWSQEILLFPLLTLLLEKVSKHIKAKKEPNAYEGPIEPRPGRCLNATS